MGLDEIHASDAAEFRRADLARPRETGKLERAPQPPMPMVAGELVAAITHDLRQPLTAVEMNVSAAILFLTRPTPQIGEAVDALNDALGQERRMRDALQVLQDLAVRHEPQREAVDVVAMVREVVGLVNADALARRVPIELDFAPRIASISGDAMLVRQAFLNILLNALEATSLSTHKRGPVRVAVRNVTSAAAAVETGGEVAEVSVTHFGDRAADGGGDQRGLALALSVVNAHGATIAFEGDPTTGVVVVTRWPTQPPDIAPHERQPGT